MPRNAYFKHFARNEADEYVGTEPERLWNDDDLEEEFGRYRDLKPTKWVIRSEDGTGKGTCSLVPGTEVYVAAEMSEREEESRLVSEREYGGSRQKSWPYRV